MCTEEKDTESKDENASQSSMWEEMKDAALLGHTQNEEEETKEESK